MTLRNLSTDERQPVTGAYLVVIRQVYPLSQGTIRIGRGPGNDLIIDDPSVSRDHLQLRLADGHYRLRDLQSTAGTCLNGQPVDEDLLTSGDLISLAGVSILYLEDSPLPLDTSRLRLIHDNNLKRASKEP